MRNVSFIIFHFAFCIFFPLPLPFSQMKVVILCGGKGTRLREETEFRPKPMVPIGDRPILWHIMKIYATHGFNEFILCLGYKGEMIKDYFRNYLWMTSDVTLSLGPKPPPKFHSHHAEEDWSVTLADTGQETMTAGRIQRIRHYLGQDQEFFLTYGDCVGNIDITAALAIPPAARQETDPHRRPSAGPLWRTGAGPPKPRHTVQRKTPGHRRPRSTAASSSPPPGFSITSATSDDMMFEQEPMLAMAARGPADGLAAHGFWQPMDTFQEFTLLNKMWAEGKAPWKTW